MKEFKVIIELNVFSKNVTTAFDGIKNALHNRIDPNTIEIIEDKGEGVCHLEYDIARDGLL